MSCASVRQKCWEKRVAFSVKLLLTGAAVVVCDPFLGNYRLRRLREALVVWLLGDCCRWIMKFGGGAEASHSAGCVLSCVMMGKCHVRARQERRKGKKRVKQYIKKPGHRSLKERLIGFCLRFMLFPN